jgi:cell division protein FtsW (lipid II flippase)
MYATQVFLTIGGAIKFIPLTGVTLPLISYGGSSLLSTLMIFGIVQGIYLIIRDEEIEVEKERKRIEMEEAEKIEE